MKGGGDSQCSSGRRRLRLVPRAAPEPVPPLAPDTVPFPWSRLKVPRSRLKVARCCFRVLDRPKSWRGHDTLYINVKAWRGGRVSSKSPSPIPQLNPATRPEFPLATVDSRPGPTCWLEQLEEVYRCVPHDVAERGEAGADPGTQQLLYVPG